jgi:hypothetical protein
MESSKGKARSSGSQDEDRGGILDRIEEKLNHLLGRRDDEWRDRGWAPLDSPFVSYTPGDASPRFFGGPPADAPGWDPSLAGPASPTSYSGGQAPLLSRHNSAREYYLLMRARAQEDGGDGAAHYADYRQRKMDEFNREYADYRREQQDRFDRDFEAWRKDRKGPAGPAEEPRRNEPNRKSRR